MLKVSGIPVAYSLFPGGEVNLCLSEGHRHEVLKEIETTGCVTYEYYGTCSDDFLALALAKNAVNQFASSQSNLVVWLLPYARQDRVCNPGEANSVQAFGALVASLNFHSVVVYDPHSDASVAAIPNAVAITQTQLLLASTTIKQLLLVKKFMLCSPDAGAEKKTNLTAKAYVTWGQTPPVVYAYKQRNLSTGEITGSTFHGNPEGRKVLIVDDLCDGGRTFIELAKLLKEEGGATEVRLYVTHGLFTKGLEPLKKHIDHVYALHTCGKLQSNDYLTVLSEIEEV